MNAVVMATAAALTMLPMQTKYKEFAAVTMVKAAPALQRQRHQGCGQGCGRLCARARAWHLLLFPLTDKRRCAASDFDCREEQEPNVANGRGRRT